MLGRAQFGVNHKCWAHARDEIVTGQSRSGYEVTTIDLGRQERVLWPRSKT